MNDLGDVKLTVDAVVFDMRAGHAAGMKTVGVLTGNDPYHDLITENPEAVIQSVGELSKVIPLYLK